MKIIVNPHSLELQKTTDVNSGEYNIQNIEFEFSSEYEELTKMAVFSNEDETFTTMITNGSCIIPSEILQTDGTIGVGVYGYSVNGDKLIKRYSPKPVFFNVELGSYQLAQESTDPSSDIITQILAQLESQGEDIVELQNNLSNLEDNVIPTLATKSEIPTKTSQLTNDSEFITKNVDDLTNYTKTSDLSSVAKSGAYSDLSGTPDLSVYATNQALGTEITNRENADINLQNQIDGISASSDVVDIVGTYQELQNYDTQHLGNNDIIKVLQDSTHNDSMTYYRWNKTGTQWIYVGQEGPYYTKSEIDTTLLPYVQNTDYATDSVGGVIRTNIRNGTSIGTGTRTGVLIPTIVNYSDYANMEDYAFIGKGTLENVITGKQLVNQTYVDNIVGDINSVIDAINGEVI